MVEIYHYNEKSKSYKKLIINEFKDGVLVKLIEGTKGSGYDDRNMFLNRMELAYLIKELERLYNNMGGDDGKAQRV